MHAVATRRSVDADARARSLVGDDGRGGCASRVNTLVGRLRAPLGGMMQASRTTVMLAGAVMVLLALHVRDAIHASGGAAGSPMMAEALRPLGGSADTAAGTAPPPPPPLQCTDQADLLPEYGGAGYCASHTGFCSHPLFARDSCALSCGRCSEPAGSAPPPPVPQRSSSQPPVVPPPPPPPPPTVDRLQWWFTAVVADCCVADCSDSELRPKLMLLIPMSGRSKIGSGKHSGQALYMPMQVARHRRHKSAAHKHRNSHALLLEHKRRLAHLTQDPHTAEFVLTGAPRP